ncbi:MAG: ECF transporter S component [Firmicutes bacterium]|nr:ECF transporter S component [Bacillota bacterium]
MKRVTYIGLFSALTYIFTAFVKVPLANQGYVHAGNVVIVVSTFLLGPLYGGIIGAIGSFFADLFVAPVWIPYTIIIKFLMAYFIGIGIKKRHFATVLFYIIGGVVFVGGYYFAEAVILGNWLVPFASTPALFAEYAISLLIGLYAAKKLEKYHITLL